MVKYVKKTTKTNDLIINSMLELAKQHGIFHVTITAIIKKANINRSTFYRHFIDRDDLIEKAEKKVLEQIKTNYDQLFQITPPDSKRDNDRTDFLQKLLTIIDNDHETISFFLSDKGDQRFNVKLIDLFLNMVRISIENSFPVNSKINREMFSYYTVGAILSTIKFWLDNYDKYTKEDVYQFILDMRRHELAEYK